MRSNASQEGGNDGDMEGPKAQAQDPLQEALNQLVNSLLEAQHQQDSESLNSKFVNCIVQDEEHGVERHLMEQLKKELNF